MNTYINANQTVYVILDLETHYRLPYLREAGYYIDANADLTNNDGKIMDEKCGLQKLHNT